jgi:hypothetical protein
MTQRLIAAFVVVLSLFVPDVMTPNVGSALTLRPVGFDDMVQQASVIVHGRVLKLESVETTGAGAAARVQGPKASQPPAAKPPGGVALSPDAAVSPPAGVGTRGGRMIFTLVTVEVIQPIKGAPGSTVEFFVAGGAVGGRAAIVPGMPKFEVGGSYVLFLRDGYWQVGDPVVGVNQGFFEVVRAQDSGQEALLSAESDFVIGIDNDRVVTRHNPGRAAGPQGPVRAPIGPPVPDRPGIQSGMSAEVQRYWFSGEPPMTVNQLATAVRSRLKR